MIRRITWKEGAALCEEIRRSPPGIWTHDLNTIRSGPARFVTRVMAQDGLEIVYFRHSGGAGAWPATNWDIFAVPRAKQSEPEQMTLF